MKTSYLTPFASIELGCPSRSVASKFQQWSGNWYTHLRIARAEREASPDKSRGIAFTRDIKILSDGNEIRGRRTMTKANHSENLPVRLEILPGTRRRTTKHKLEPERAGIPRLIRERRFLMLSVERANSRERDRMVTEQHRVVVPEKRRRDSADRKYGDPDDR